MERLPRRWRLLIEWGAVVVAGTFVLVLIGSWPC